MDQQNFMVVRTDVPHKTYSTEEPIILLSVRFKKISSWDDQINDLRKFGVINDRT